MRMRTTLGRGRLASALAGHDGTWHLRANRVERGKIKATYAVVFAPGVPVRAQPHVDSAVIRRAKGSAWRGRR